MVGAKDERFKLCLKWAEARGANTHTIVADASVVAGSARLTQHRYASLLMSPEVGALAGPWAPGGADDVDRADEANQDDGQLLAMLRTATAHSKLMNHLVKSWAEGRKANMLVLLPSSGSSADGPVPAGIKGTVQRERLRLLLKQKPGVHSNIFRRTGGDDFGDDAVPDTSVYLERFGGFNWQTKLGPARLAHSGCPPRLRLGREC